MNKKVKIRFQTYELYDAPTGTVFVRSHKTRQTYPIARLVDGELKPVPEPALRAVDNDELLAAWLEQ